MELRRDLDYALGSLLIGGVVLALVTIGLFARMTPAIERIREDNLVTLEATHSLLAVFVRRAGEELEMSDREIVEKALIQMRDNLTVENEGRLVDAVTDAVAAAQSGDRQAFVRLVAAVDELTVANAAAMVEADREAQRLGVAGAWTASLGGLFLVLIGVFARTRLRRRLIRPVEEVARVLEARALGDGLVRCRAMEGAVELERALAAVNGLLDTRHEGTGKEQGKRRGQKKKGQRLAARLVENAPSAAESVRLTAARGADTARLAAARGADTANLEAGPATVHALALHALLAVREGPWVVTSVDFGLVAANDAAFERLGADDGAALLERLKAGEGDPKDRIDLGDGLVLARLGQY